jgi:hypothetical protein
MDCFNRYLDKNTNMHEFIIFTKLFKMLSSHQNIFIFFFATKVTNVESLFLKHFPHFKIIS